MEAILKLLGGLDWTAILAALGSFVLGFGFLKGKLDRAKHVILDVEKLLSDFSKSLEDDQIKKDELQLIVADIKGIIEAFKGKI